MTRKTGKIARFIATGGMTPQQAAELDPRNSDYYLGKRKRGPVRKALGVIGGIFGFLYFGTMALTLITGDKEGFSQFGLGAVFVAGFLIFWCIGGWRIALAIKRYFRGRRLAQSADRFRDTHFYN